MLLFTLTPFDGRVRALPFFVIAKGLDSLRGRIATGAGMRVRLDPSHHARALIADWGRGMLPKLDESGAFALAAPDFEGVQPNAEKSGGLLVAEQVTQVDRVDHSIHSEERCRRLFGMVTRPDERLACARGTKRDFHPPACPVASLEFSSRGRPSAALSRIGGTGSVLRC